MNYNLVAFGLSSCVYDVTTFLFLLCSRTSYDTNDESLLFYSAISLSWRTMPCESEVLATIKGNPMYQMRGKYNGCLKTLSMWLSVHS